MDTVFPGSGSRTSSQQLPRRATSIIILNGTNVIPRRQKSNRRFRAFIPFRAPTPVFLQPALPAELSGCLIPAIKVFRVPAVPAILFAFDLNNLGNELWDRSLSGQRDAAGNAVKFSVPTVANGKVYIGTRTELDVYGLLG